MTPHLRDHALLHPAMIIIRYVPPPPPARPLDPPVGAQRGLQPISSAGGGKRKRHTMPHSAQPQHTNYWALRTRKRHQQEHRPQRPTESSTQHAKGRTDDCPGPRKGATTRRNVTRGGATPAQPASGGGCLPQPRWAVCATGAGAHQGQASREGEKDIWWTAGTMRRGTGHLGLTHTETQQGRLWTACGQRHVDSKNSQTTRQQPAHPQFSPTIGRR